MSVKFDIVSHLHFKIMVKDTKSKDFDLDLLREDDEFEEFPAEDWTNQEKESSDVNVWEDTWDDDDVEDAFSQQLRSELEKPSVKHESDSMES